MSLIEFLHLLKELNAKMQRVSHARNKSQMYAIALRSELGPFPRGPLEGTITRVNLTVN